MDTNQLKFLMYRSADGDVSVNAIIKDETIWLTQKAMAELFGVDKSSISRHLKNIFVEGELDNMVQYVEKHNLGKLNSTTLTPSSLSGIVLIPVGRHSSGSGPPAY